MSYDKFDVFKDKGLLFQQNGSDGLEFQKIPKAGLYFFPKLIKIGKNCMVTDPCYKPKTWCQYEVKGMRPGNYQVGAYMKDEGPGGFGGIRVAASFLIHEDVFYRFNGKYLKIEDFKKIEKAHIGVDAGIAGFYDKKEWMKQHKSEKIFDEFYDKIGNTVLSEGFDGHHHAGTYEDWGFTSFSGLGDGGYPLFEVKDNNETVALAIDFLNVIEPCEDDIEDEE